MLSALVAAILLTPEASATDPLAEAQAELSAAKQAYLDARKNKSNLEEAALKYGQVVVTSDALRPNEKYPLALALFRQTLAINSQNSDAKDWEETIVGIYAGMGKEPRDFDLSTIK